MSQTGLGVLIRRLGSRGDGLEKAIEALECGLPITALSLNDKTNSLEMELAGQTKLRWYDGGQSCCESRYLRTDDDLSYFVGAKLTGFEERPIEVTELEHGDIHEICFLDIRTDRGVFTLANHNEHNGYYGGFFLNIETMED